MLCGTTVIRRKAMKSPSESILSLRLTLNRIIWISFPVVHPYPHSTYIQLYQVTNLKHQLHYHGGHINPSRYGFSCVKQAKEITVISMVVIKLLCVFILSFLAKQYTASNPYLII